MYKIVSVVISAYIILVSLFLTYMVTILWSVDWTRMDATGVVIFLIITILGMVTALMSPLLARMIDDAFWKEELNMEIWEKAARVWFRIWFVLAFVPLLSVAISTGGIFGDEGTIGTFLIIEAFLLVPAAALAFLIRWSRDLHEWKMSVEIF